MEKHCTVSRTQRDILLVVPTRPRTCRRPISGITHTRPILQHSPEDPKAYIQTHSVEHWVCEQRNYTQRHHKTADSNRSFAREAAHGATIHGMQPYFKKMLLDSRVLIFGRCVLRHLILTTFPWQNTRKQTTVSFESMAKTLTPRVVKRKRVVKKQVATETPPAVAVDSGWSESPSLLQDLQSCILPNPSDMISLKADYTSFEFDSEEHLMQVVLHLKHDCPEIMESKESFITALRVAFDKTEQ